MNLSEVSFEQKWKFIVFNVEILHTYPKFLKEMMIKIEDGLSFVACKGNFLFWVPYCLGIIYSRVDIPPTLP